MLIPGDPAPFFTAPSTVNPRFVFDTVGGRYITLCFFRSAADPAAQRILRDLDQHRATFNVTNACFCGVSIDPDDQRLNRLTHTTPGIIHFFDTDLAVSKLYATASADGRKYQRCTVVLDPAFRVLAVLPIDGAAEGHVAKLVRYLDSLPPIASLTWFAPVLIVPYVFEPGLCRTLIDEFDRHGGRDSGFMRDVDGKTVEVSDPNHKRRRDHHITDQKLIQAAMTRLHRRLVPEIHKAFAFTATRIERHIVACYDAEQQGHFRAHRDNTTMGTAHRRFAVTLNLNADEYDGGDLRFPEFGPRAYRAPTGGAVVFSCSLLHEATPVTRGKRYAYLPFLYDEPAAAIRQQNLQYLAAPPMSDA